MPRQIGIRIFLLFFSLIIALLFVELFLRTVKKPINEIESVSSYTQFNINYGLELKSNYNYEEYGYREKISSYGFYSPTISLKKKGKRIAYIGDSYSIAPGIAMKDNFPYKVSEKLKSEKKMSDYLVAAVPGTSPFSNKFVYKSKVVQFKPDIVVYQSFDNDIDDDYIFAYSQYYARMKVWNSVPPVLRNSMTIQQLMIIATEFLSNYFKSVYTKTWRIIEEDPEKVWNEYSKPSLNEFLQISRKNNVKLIILHIPDGRVFPYEHRAKPLKAKYVLGELLEKWTKENKVPYVEMYGDFEKRNTEEFNEIYLPEAKGYHLTQEGAEIVSKKLYDAIKFGGS